MTIVPGARRRCTGGYTNLKYWLPDNDANDVDVERVAPCTLFHYDRGHSSGQWFDATEVGRYYTRDALRGLDNRADSIYVAPGYKCTLWRDYAAGDSRTFHPGLHLHHDLRYAHLDDRASAVLVERLDASGEERGCYPATGKLMIFPGNSEDVSHRISVYANGDVYDGYEKHTKRRGWTSISNLALRRQRTKGAQTRGQMGTQRWHLRSTRIFMRRKCCQPGWNGEAFPALS